MGKFLAVSEHLAEVNKLPYDAHLCLITGLTIGSVEAFTESFKLILNQARVNTMGMEVSLTDESSPLLKKIKEIAESHQLVVCHEHFRHMECP